MLGQLGLRPHFPVGCVKEDEPSVLASPGDDGAVLEDADGEDGSVVHLPQGLGHSVEAPSPDEDVAVGVPSQNVAGETEGQARHVLRLITLIEQTCKIKRAVFETLTSLGAAFLKITKKVSKKFKSYEKKEMIEFHLFFCSM